MLGVASFAPTKELTEEMESSRHYTFGSMTENESFYGSPKESLIFNTCELILLKSNIKLEFADFRTTTEVDLIALPELSGER